MLVSKLFCEQHNNSLWIVTLKVFNMSPTQEVVVKFFTVTRFTSSTSRWIMQPFWYFNIALVKIMLLVAGEIREEKKRKKRKKEWSLYKPRLFCVFSILSDVQICRQHELHLVNMYGRTSVFVLFLAKIEDYL